MTTSRRLGLGLLLVLALCDNVLCLVKDCSRNTYNFSDSHMHFTKESTFAEFAINGKFKGLHCCAKGYRSIEWLKDGKLYPWSSSTSGLILYPESANQTIYTQAVTADDAGNYTCLIKNDTYLLEHTVQLQVYDKAPDQPKITYMSEDLDVSVGHRVRLFCEAFVGVVDLPDAYNEAIWRKHNHNGSIDDEPRIRQQKVSREDGQTFGTYLIIEEIRPEDFGTYICKISKPGRTKDLPVHIREKVYVEYLAPNPIPWKKMIVWFSVIVVVLFSLTILNFRYGLALRVKFKDRFGSDEQGDGKSSDVLIAYSSDDAEVVLGSLLTTLENEYKYKCATRELPVNVHTWCANLSEASAKSRRLVAVLSPGALNNQWDTSTVYQALKQLNALNVNLTCVALHAMPKNDNEVKNAEGETLASVLRTTSVIDWNRENSKTFWLRLRLRLPSKRDDNAGQQQQANQTTRLNSESLDSLDVFV